MVAIHKQNQVIALGQKLKITLTALLMKGRLPLLLKVIMHLLMVV